MSRISRRLTPPTGRGLCRQHSTSAALLARACWRRRRRDLFPNVLAVDFYRQGDVFRVVDTLNGVGGEPATAR